MSLLNKEPVKKNTLISMIDSIKHRGPDGEGYWTHNNIGIIHPKDISLKTIKSDLLTNF